MVGGKDETPDSDAGLDNGGPIIETNKRAGPTDDAESPSKAAARLPMVQVPAMRMSAIMRGGRATGRSFMKQSCGLI